MSIFILNNGSYRLATDLDLLNRGYQSTQSLGAIPVDNTDVTFWATGVTNWSRDNSKVIAIKIIRNTIKDYYQRDFQTGKCAKTPPQQQGDFENPFGLKHTKWLVEQAVDPSTGEITTVTVSLGCFNEIKSALAKENMQLTLESDLGSNNLDRLKEHREKLMEEIRKVDNLIAYQLYS